jgi:hypothetical protein
VAGEVFVSAAVKDIVTGSRLSFEERGEHETQGHAGNMDRVHGREPRLGLGPRRSPGNEWLTFRRYVILDCAAS